MLGMTLSLFSVFLLIKPIIMMGLSISSDKYVIPFFQSHSLSECKRSDMPILALVSLFIRIEMLSHR